MLTAARSSSNNRLYNNRIEAGVCNITKEDLVNIWNIQNGKCYYSGIQMVLQPCSHWMCSLERLDNVRGYVTDNIALVCHEFNTDSKWTVDKVKQMIFLVYEYHDNASLVQEIDNVLNSVNPPRNRDLVVKNDIDYYKCKKCNIFKPITEFGLNRIGRGCKICIKKHKDEYSSTIKGHLHELLKRAKCHTKSRNKSNRSGDNIFDITYEDLVNLLRNQCGRCAYSNIRLHYGPSRKKNWVSSLERINPLRGYTRDNICLVCAEFNGVDHTAIMKYSNGYSGAWSKEKFIFFLSTILSNIGPNLILNLGGPFISLDMWKLINNPLYVQNFPVVNFQLEIVNPGNVQQNFMI